MKSGAVIALMVAALSVPVFAQRGSAHDGFGNRGYGGHGGLSARPIPGHSGSFGHRGFSEPKGYAPAPTFRYGSLGPPPAVRYNPPNISAPRIGVGQNGIVPSRPPYRTEFDGGNRAWNGNRDRGRNHRRDRDGDRDHDHDRGRFRRRARSFDNLYLFGYPGWVGYGYPYDPGFYDSSDYGNSGYEQNSEASGYGNENPGAQQEPAYGGYTEPGIEDCGGENEEPCEQPQPWPEPPASQPSPQSDFWVSGLSAASAPSPSGPLTVIFKGGRAPEQMRNYMLTATALTDLDADRYEQIPLGQIDLAATARANRAGGLEFRVPGASQN